MRSYMAEKPPPVVMIPPRVDEHAVSPTPLHCRVSRLAVDASR